MGQTGRRQVETVAESYWRHSHGAGVTLNATLNRRGSRGRHVMLAGVCVCVGVCDSDAVSSDCHS